jgi:hypothetical protein
MENVCEQCMRDAMDIVETTQSPHLLNIARTDL